MILFEGNQRLFLYVQFWNIKELYFLFNLLKHDFLSPNFPNMESFVYFCTIHQMMSDMENKSLGMIIREERKKKGLTQAQLGKLIGLKESRVSKIEHGAPITPEVASFILGKMGSALQINVVDKAGFNQEESEFIMSVINNFADEKKIPLTKAYNYIVTFKGMDFMRQYQDIEKTLSNQEIVNDVSRVCANNGGRLWFSITAVTNWLPE